MIMADENKYLTLNSISSYPCMIDVLNLDYDEMTSHVEYSLTTFLQTCVPTAECWEGRSITLTSSNFYNFLYKAQRIYLYVNNSGSGYAGMCTLYPTQRPSSEEEISAGFYQFCNGLDPSVDFSQTIYMEVNGDLITFFGGAVPEADE